MVFSFYVPKLKINNNHKKMLKYNLVVPRKKTNRTCHGRDVLRIAFTFNVDEFPET